MRSYDDLNQVKIYFGVKAFSVRDMEGCYLHKNLHNYSGFYEGL